MPPSNAELRDAVQAVRDACTQFRLLLNRATGPQRTAVLGTWPWSGSDLDMIDMDEWASVACQELDALPAPAAIDIRRRTG